MPISFAPNSNYAVTLLTNTKRNFSYRWQTKTSLLKKNSIGMLISSTFLGGKPKMPLVLKRALIPMCGWVDFWIVLCLSLEITLYHKILRIDQKSVFSMLPARKMFHVGDDDKNDSRKRIVTRPAHTKKVLFYLFAFFPQLSHSFYWFSSFCIE